ncbi:protein-S-isoprenylcysteine O-methyltransferase Ste14 [Sphingomonas insulae]|uniref:Protein-S-isoprenylcysteine O-methyltransferase n=2 Tax=Sphingomonas insulae TaxID=424800 RepID=A0ABN1HZK8_9SPHN|nr:isoprenylcysteine carboxylmethyltransferase family protein [Sphingomonas insulae]NIJ29513.1 protein-S-isoprenylcysteine O-methyltransferase Ste14 [Sphingomonas insulae]
MSGAAGLPGIAALATGLLLFAIALVAARWRRPREVAARRDAMSTNGIALQGAAVFTVMWGQVRVTLDPLGTAAIGAAIVTALLFAVALALFLWSTAAMGHNWSLVARVRSDHQLVTRGPFAHIRHPIYTALALVVVAAAVATGRLPRLLIALPLYGLGTWLRVRIEERLLHAAFGVAYEDYAGRVKRFLPSVF